MENKSFAALNCVVERGLEKLRVQVPRHEFEVLRALHGDENAHILGEAGEPVELSPSIEEEWSRLTRLYFHKGQSNPVALAFPAGARQLAEFGFVQTGAALKRPEQSDARVRPKVKAKEPPKARSAA